MATFTGTMTSTSRQGSGGTETRTFTVTNPGPPPVEKTFEASETYFEDAKDAGGKMVTVTYDDAVSPHVCLGLKTTY